jgi:hypothetical protein
MANIFLNQDEYKFISDLILNYNHEIRSYNVRDRFAEDLYRYLNHRYQEALHLGNKTCYKIYINCLFNNYRRQFLEW